VAGLGIDIPGILNFGKVDNVLYRGAQPGVEGFLELKKRGIKTIVSLRTNSDEKFLWGTGLFYRQLPCKLDLKHPGADIPEIQRFLRLMQKPELHPVYVHCLCGMDRTGVAVATYRVLYSGWTKEDAIKEMHGYRFHDILFWLDDFIEKMDVEKFRAEVNALPIPAVAR